MSQNLYLSDNCCVKYHINTTGNFNPLKKKLSCSSTLENDQCIAAESCWSPSAQTTCFYREAMEEILCVTWGSKEKKNYLALNG